MSDADGHRQTQEAVKRRAPWQTASGMERKVIVVNDHFKKENFMKKNHIVALVAASLLATGCAGMKGQSSEAKAPQATAGASTAATGGAAATGDAAITAKIKSALQADAELSAFKIDVTTAEGVVKMKGEIKSMALRKKAEALVRDTAGVKSVDNQLIITG
jgi:hyperosmotically inducible periplasmic protein